MSRQVSSRRRNPYKMAHRWVAEQKLGRELRPGEVVHHIDGDPTNNDPDNLQVFASEAEHRAVHRGVEVGADLREVRDKLGRSRSWVARSLEPPISEKTLERWEKRVVRVPAWRLEQLAALYEVPVDVLAGRVAA